MNWGHFSDVINPKVIIFIELYTCMFQNINPLAHGKCGHHLNGPTFNASLWIISGKFTPHSDMYPGIISKLSVSQVKSWYHQVGSHYLNRWFARSLMQNCFTLRPSQWRHMSVKTSEFTGFYRIIDHLFNSLFRLLKTKTSILCITGLFKRHRRAKHKIPQQRTYNVESFSRSRRHHGTRDFNVL